MGWPCPWQLLCLEQSTPQGNPYTGLSLLSLGQVGVMQEAPQDVGRVSQVCDEASGLGSVTNCWDDRGKFLPNPWHHSFLKHGS